MSMLKRSLKRATPPLLVDLYHRLRTTHGFSGRYSSWEEAMSRCTGYDSPLILQKTRDSLLAIKEGRAVFERDSVLFDRPYYSWPVLTGLFWAATADGTRGLGGEPGLSVLDFGGSLGSHYFQFRRFLSHLPGLRWNVVEQEHVVDCGRSLFANNQLNFYASLEECLRLETPRAALVSCSVQYLESPHAFLAELVEKKIDFLIFDRTPFIEESRDRLTIQSVPASIYEATYPAWFFHREGFLDHFREGYALEAEFDSGDEVNIPSAYKGFIFRRRGSRIEAGR